ncbi:multicopper oxidase-domain-containing protein [Syncephalastrum racemosum]|uniref:Multicopper oxidase-domain-containing protein n=1 Tax=Syncephalastrum racemosum TaxID=13706 RepID=A0A1X2HLS0_SYNRA|nr:multicopper oxidase-domain-containing protein [Syncephalastrum racemosum]
MRSFLSILAVSSAASVASAALRRFDLNITSNLLNPDCHTGLIPAPLVNNQFQGPAIRVAQGDDVEITVRNMMDEPSASTSVHFHGIRQIGTVESDGVPGVTQIAIPPDESFVYKFRVVGQTGTYFYHAHVGMQDDTVQGPFIVHPDEESMPEEMEAHVDEPLQEGPYRYDGERILQLSEWWHQDFMSREQYYMGEKFVFDHGADSILLNGRTVHQANYEDEEIGMEDDESCMGYSALDVAPGKTYRVRIIGAQTFRTLALAFAQHKLTIIEVDGQLVEPYETDWLEIGPGQRFSVLLETHAKPPTRDGLVPIATGYRWRHRAAGGPTENGFAYLRYSEDGMPDLRGVHKPVLVGKNATADQDPDWIWPEITPLVEEPGSAEILSREADRVIKLRSASTKFANNQTRYLMNGRMPFNNVFGGHNCLIHPWHTHGHSHYLIASGPGEYDHALHKDIRNFPNPVYKDVSLVYPSEADTNGQGCGWTKVRIYADNPGVWAVHCHITSHMMQGKFAVLEESPELIESHRLYK